MIELTLVFVGGVLGSSHCLGMCGPFALALGSGAPAWSANLRRQTAYTLGRVFTYSFLGAAAGFGGAHLTANAPSVVNVAAALAVLAGVFLMYQGAKSLGWFRAGHAAEAGGPCLAAGVIGPFLRPRAQNRGETAILRDVFLAGLFTGLLPCGLVYGFLALAASSQSVLAGAATMAAFGLGTGPMMVAAGWGGSLLRGGARRRVFQFAAWCVVLTGAITVGRGLGYVSLPGMQPAPGCPFCQHGDVSP